MSEIDYTIIHHHIHQIYYNSYKPNGIIANSIELICQHGSYSEIWALNICKLSVFTIYTYRYHIKSYLCTFNKKNRI